MSRGRSPRAPPLQWRCGDSRRSRMFDVWRSAELRSTSGTAIARPCPPLRPQPSPRSSAPISTRGSTARDKRPRDRRIQSFRQQPPLQEKSPALSRDVALRLRPATHGHVLRNRSPSAGLSEREDASTVCDQSSAHCCPTEGGHQPRVWSNHGSRGVAARTDRATRARAIFFGCLESATLMGENVRESSQQVMSMPILIPCPQCRRQYSLGDEFAGHQFKCQQCGASFTAPAALPSQTGGYYLPNGTWTTGGSGPPAANSGPSDLQFRIGGGLAIGLGLF